MVVKLYTKKICKNFDFKRKGDHLTDLPLKISQFKSDKSYRDINVCHYYILNMYICIKKLIFNSGKCLIHISKKLMKFRANSKLYFYF